MKKILLVGNPNVGKTTIFNAITKQHEHIGNWNGVTVDASSFVFKYKNDEYELIDLPGIYSMNPYSIEEGVSVDSIKQNPDAVILYILSTDCFYRNLFLLEELKNYPNDIVVILNVNSKNFNINNDKLKKIISLDKIIIVKNKKLNKVELFKNINSKKNINIIKKNNLNNTEIYNKITKNLNKNYNNCNFLNKIFKNKIFLMLFSLFYFLFIFYFTFSSVGVFLSDLISDNLNLFFNFILNIINLNNVFLLNFISDGVLSPIISVISFAPQIFFLNMFMKIFEETGVLSRLAFYTDDILRKVGLNGRSIYTLLLGFGCGSVACVTAKSNTDENVKIRTAMVTPFMSCSAKLPVYFALTSVFFGVRNFWIIIMLYLIGVFVALACSKFYEKKMRSFEKNNFIMEVTRIKMPDYKLVLVDSCQAVFHFVTKIFKIVLVVSALVWLLSHLQLNFSFTFDISNSILYKFSKLISFIFVPIGLDNPAIIVTLIVGVLAKELILSTMVLLNSTTINELGNSILSGQSLISLNIYSVLSLLVFILLYVPCLSNLSVLKKELPKKYFNLSIITHLSVAYIMSFIVYNLARFQSFNRIIIICIFIILMVLLLFKILKNQKNCCKCLKKSCKNCKK